MCFLFYNNMSGQNTIVYSYDSAGNRTQRDTTSTNVAMSPAVDRNGVLEASYDLPSTGDFDKYDPSTGQYDGQWVWKKSVSTYGYYHDIVGLDWLKYRLRSKYNDSVLALDGWL